MNISSLKKLISQGESETLEFKKSTTQLKSAAETLCAFLNSKGGTVVIGVSDKGEINGQHVTDNTRQEIANILVKFEPTANIEVNYCAFEKDKKIILLHATPDKNSVPYTFHGRSYERNDSAKSIMSQTRYQQLLMHKNVNCYSWEDLASNECSIDDLDKERIYQVVRLAISEKRLTELAMRASIKEILAKLKLLVDGKPKNAAVVLFCKDEQKQFIQSCIRMARFKGTNKREFIDNKSIQGNAFELHEKAMAFLHSYLPIVGKIEEGNPFRVDTPAIPVV